MWYIIRHGQTLSNDLSIKQGHKPSLLTLKGISQAQSYGNRLAETNEDFTEYKFLVSPLIRTRHTMQIILEILDLKKVVPFEEELLISRSKGILEGLNREELEKKYPDELEKQKNDKWNYFPPEGESRNSCFNRVKTFIKKYEREKNLVIVTHSGLVRLLNHILVGKSLKEIKIGIGTETVSTSQNYFYFWDGIDVTKM
jgi:probable phosphoglycerate mutase